MEIFKSFQAAHRTLGNLTGVPGKRACFAVVARAARNLLAREAHGLASFNMQFYSQFGAEERKLPPFHYRFKCAGTPDLPLTDNSVKRAPEVRAPCPGQIGRAYAAENNGKGGQPGNAVIVLSIYRFRSGSLGVRE